jgi:hypothetical protein
MEAMSWFPTERYFTGVPFSREYEGNGMTVVVDAVTNLTLTLLASYAYVLVAPVFVLWMSRLR